MKNNFYAGILSVCAIMCVTACDDASDSGDTPTTPNGSTDPDNTSNNEGDGSEYNQTPIDQSESGDSIDITAKIRRAIIDDDSMSINAQNCKIMTDSSGYVTLRGVVNSQAEKDAIEAKAKEIAGASRVDNQLEVNAN